MESKVTYLQAGEYQIPNLTVPTEKLSLNKYSRMRKRFLQEHRTTRYTTLLMSGQLTKHLHQVGERTQEQVKQTMEALLEKNPAPPKANGSLQWAQHMNMIRHQAEELVLPETVYV